jgi:hypothetical protein
MAAVGRKDAHRSMCRKGFEPDADGSPDHLRLVYRVNGKPAIRTFVSHSGRDLDDNLISRMSRQTHLTRSEFLAFARCEMSEAEYRQILIREGIIPGPE